MTYTGQGVNKKGVKAKYHAVIYTGKKPVTFDGERSKGLKMSPIKMVPISSRHKLDNASRLNYAKQYTVEHNVKVWFVGEVSPDSEDQLVEDYNKTNPPMEKGKGRSKGKIIEEEEDEGDYGDQTPSQASPTYPSTSAAPYFAYPAASSYAQQTTGYGYGNSTNTQYKITPSHAGYDQQDSTASYFGNQSYPQPSAGSYSAHQGGSQSSDPALQSEAPQSETSPHTLPENESEEPQHHVDDDVADDGEKDDYGSGDIHE
jgi:hypothetical protein